MAREPRENCTGGGPGQARRALGTLVGQPGPLPGRRRCVAIGDGARIALRDIDGPPLGAAVVLLHGWAATADLNFAATYADLATRWRVIAPDQRGHGRSAGDAAAPFSLEACADDAAELIRRTGTAPALVLGYSMGGPVGLLLARRHPDLVAGLVLVATAARFSHGAGERAALGALGAAGALGRRLGMRLCTVGHRLPDACPILQAGGALGRFRAEAWLGDLRLPVAVVITAGDHLVPPADQRRLADAIPGAFRLVVAGGHDLCLRHPRSFARAAMQALGAVEHSHRAGQHRAA